MDLDRQQLQAAHELGEAILRFFHAIEKKPASQSLQATAVDKVANLDFEDRLLRAGEAAQILSIGRSMIYELMNSGRLPSVRIGSARRFKLSEIRKLIENNRLPPGSNLD